MIPRALKFVVDSSKQNFGLIKRVGGINPKISFSRFSTASSFQTWRPVKQAEAQRDSRAQSTHAAVISEETIQAAEKCPVNHEVRAE